MKEIYDLRLQLEQNAKLQAQRERLFQVAVNYANRLLDVCVMRDGEFEMRLMSAFNDAAIVAEVIEFIVQE